MHMHDLELDLALAVGTKCTKCYLGEERFDENTT